MDVRSGRNSSRVLHGTRRLALMFCLMVYPCLAATTQHEVFKNANPFDSTSLNAVDGLDRSKAILDNPTAANDLITTMRLEQGKVCNGAYCLPELNKHSSDTYVLIHLLRWADSSTPTKPTVQSDHWYLYRDVAAGHWSQEDFTIAKRLLGVTKVYVLLVQFNATHLLVANKVTYQPQYDFAITKKTPANLTHLYALLQAYAGGANAGQAASTQRGQRVVAPDAVWGGGVLDIQYRPADILIKSGFTLDAGGQEQKLADDVTFDNEGLYYWDVGFAVPVRKISEIKVDSTSGTATPATVNSQNVFAILDGYYPPIDVKGSGFRAIPHPIAGVAFAKRPLSKILIGGAWGPHSSELYMGAVFVKEPELSGSTSCGSPSGSSTTNKSHYCAQFTIGINLSVSAIATKLGAPK
jgi:hypothetical protein